MEKWALRLERRGLCFHSEERLFYPHQFKTKGAMATEKPHLFRKYKAVVKT